MERRFGLPTAAELAACDVPPELTIELIDWCHAQGVLGCFTFDIFYTCAEIQNHIHALKNEDGTERGYVGGTDSRIPAGYFGVIPESVCP